jgi:hypothetical protein
MAAATATGAGLRREHRGGGRTSVGASRPLGTGNPSDRPSVSITPAWLSVLTAIQERKQQETGTGSSSNCRSPG